MPNLGLKYTLLSKDSLKFGVDLSIYIYKPFVSGKIEDDGEEGRSKRIYTKLITFICRTCQKKGCQ